MKQAHDLVSASIKEVESASFSIRIFIAVLDELGLHRAEAFFEWADADLRDAEILIHGKGGDIRLLPLSLSLVRLLSWLRQRSPEFPWREHEFSHWSTEESSLLFVTQSFDGIKRSGLTSGVEPEEDADGKADSECQYH